jgi:hypothetical protein
VWNLGQFCLKVKTGNGNDSDGFIKIWVDHGAGYQAKPTSDDKYAFGSVVLDECYFTFVSLQVQNKIDNAWKGAILFSTDGGVTYSSMECTIGCGGRSAVSTQLLQVDKADSSGCGDGRLCTIKPRKYHVHSHC